MLRISWSTSATSTSEAGDLESKSTEHTLQFDAVTSESHEATSVLTEHAVESGAPISDHKRANPERISIEALITNTPLDTPPPSGYGTSGITTSLSKEDDKVSVLLYSAKFDRISDVISTLRRLRLEATELTVSTRIHTYESVQLVSVTVPRTPEDGESVKVTLELQQVRIAQSRTVDAPRPREPRGRPRTDRGGQEGGETRQTQSTLSAFRERLDAGEGFQSAALGALGG